MYNNKIILEIILQDNRDEQLTEEEQVVLDACRARTAGDIDKLRLFSKQVWNRHKKFVNENSLSPSKVIRRRYRNMSIATAMAVFLSAATVVWHLRSSHSRQPHDFVDTTVQAVGKATIKLRKLENPRTAIAWMDTINPAIQFEDEDLRIVIRRLAQYYNKKVDFSVDQSTDRFSGMLPLRKSFAENLGLIDSTMKSGTKKGPQFEERNGTIYMSDSLKDSASRYRESIQ